MLQGLIIPRILDYSQEQSGGVGYAVGLCLALFVIECFKSLSMCACWVVSQRTGVRFRAAAASLAFQKLLQFKSLTHITTGEVSARAAGQRCLGPGEGEGMIPRGVMAISSLAGVPGQVSTEPGERVPPLLRCSYRACSGVACLGPRGRLPGRRVWEDFAAQGCPQGKAIPRAPWVLPR